MPELVETEDVNPLPLPKGHDKSLTHRLLIDTAVGGFAGFSLAWFITPMDQAVMESMSGKKTLIGSLKSSGRDIFKTPFKYVRSPQYGYVVGTYAGTYLSKNVSDTMCVYTKQTPEKTAFYKFWLVFAFNGGLSVFWKDPGMARLFGTGSAVKMPPSVYGAWALRDGVHLVGACLAADYLEEKLGWTKAQWRNAQLAFPLMIQIVTTPLHLTGLDFFNHKKSSIGDRFARVRKAWLPSAGIRMIRMFAPWSLGLLICRDLRDYLIEN